MVENTQIKSVSLYYKDNKDLSEKYPFEKSFDELTVNNWVNHQIRSIKDEN